MSEPVLKARASVAVGGHLRLVPAVRRGAPVPGYQVGCDGTIYTFWHKVGNGRIRWGIGAERKALIPYPITRNGSYLGVALRCGGRTIRVSVHALVMESFVGPCPAGLEICHGNGNGHDNALSNLRYDTPANNQADKVRHGTHQFGERNPSAKLTNDEADAIRWLRSLGLKLKTISSWFGVAESAVSRIANNKRRAR